MARKQFPRTHKALVLEGYRFIAAGICREPGCGAKIWWYQTPGGRRLPIDVATMRPHQWRCPGVERNKRGAPGPRAQLELFPG